MGYEKSAHLYDLFDKKDNIEFFYQYASRAGEALDIGAGTGRIAIPLARRGIRLWCVEPSPAMRREFKKKLAGRKETIQLIAGNAATFTIARSFPLAFLSGCFDHFLESRERRAALANIGSHLAPGGTLVFDVFLGLMGNRPLSPAGEARLGSMLIRRMVRAKAVSATKQRMELVFEIYKCGNLSERIEETGMVRITDRQDIHRVLRETGFEVRQEWSDYNFTPYNEGDSLLIIEAVMSGNVV
jgi:SAM-dependent methyltransferase